jgi:hypothetical protein
MPTTISAVRASLLTDSHDQPLPSPQPIDLATQEIPYGTRVRLEVDLDSAELVMPLGARAFCPGTGTEREYGGLTLYRSGAGNTFAANIRLPWGAFWREDPLPCAVGPPRFPLPDGWPWIPGGEHALRFVPWPVSGPIPDPAVPPLEVRFRLGQPVGPGGAAPRIVQFGSDLGGSDVQPGQPWLLTAQAQDQDNDIVAVLFTAVRGEQGRSWQLWNDGAFGDVAPRDGLWSVMRVGSDWFDHSELGGTKAVPVTVVAQAVDLRGNWSDPVSLDYTLRCDREPLWMEGPDPAGPSITEAGLSREQGPPDYPFVWARCDSLDARVCARVIARPASETCCLLDDGIAPDVTARDGLYARVSWFPRTRHWDAVLYAVPKAGALRVGEKLAVSCPPIA